MVCGTKPHLIRPNGSLSSLTTSAIKGFLSTLMGVTPREGYYIYLKKLGEGLYHCEKVPASQRKFFLSEWYQKIVDKVYTVSVP